MAMKEKRARFKEKGFSLTELLVVVVIIGLLLGISIPAISSQLRKMDNTGCISHMRNLGLLMDRYAMENDGRYPAVYAGGSGSTVWVSELFALWQPDEPWLSGNRSVIDTIFECPAARRDIQARGLSSRLANGNISYGMPRNLPSEGGGNQSGDKKMSTLIKEPSKTCLLIENDNAVAAGVSGRRQLIENVIGRHETHVNVLFCDGHIEARTLPEIPLDNNPEGRTFWRGQ